MMVAVKGMKMPKSCSQCPLCIEDKYADMTCVLLCEEWEESNYNENHRDENCPLAEEIITCKNCKGTEHDAFCFHKTGKLKGHAFCDVHQVYVKEDDFCSRGKRRS